MEVIDFVHKIFYSIPRKKFHIENVFGGNRHEKIVP